MVELVNRNGPNVIFDPEALKRALKQKEKEEFEKAHPELKKAAEEKLAKKREQKQIDGIANDKIQRIADIRFALKEVETFSQLKFIAKKAKARLSPSGKRYIIVRGHEGTLPIDALAAKVLELVKKNPDFDEVERRHGKAIIKSIGSIYMKSYRQIVNAKGLTKFLAKLRGIPYLILSCFSRDYSKIQWNWRYCEIETEFTSNPDNRGNYRVFELYTKNQYREVFKKEPDEEPIKLHGLDIPYFEKPADN